MTYLKTIFFLVFKEILPFRNLNLGHMVYNIFLKSKLHYTGASKLSQTELIFTL